MKVPSFRISWPARLVWLPALLIILGCSVTRVPPPNPPSSTLLTQLKDPTPEKRMQAVWTLAATENPDNQTIEALIDALDDSDPGVASQAAEVLGNFGDSRAVAPLMELVVRDGLAREAAVRALHGFKATDPEFVARRRAELDDPDWKIRRNAAATLGALKVRSAVEPLVLRLKDPNPEVRAFAAEALGTIGGKAALEPLVRLLSDPRVPPRTAAAVALGNAKDPRAVEPLIKAFVDINALFHISPTDVTDTQLEDLQNPDHLAAMQERIPVLLGNLRDRRAVQPLFNIVNNPEKNWRYCYPSFPEVAEALGKIGDRRLVPLLLFLLKKPGEDLGLRETAARILGKLKAREAFPFLIAVVKSAPDTPFTPPKGYEMVKEDRRNFYRIFRGTAAESLGELGDRRAVPVLLAIVKNPQEDICLRITAAEALGTLADPRASDTLLGILRSPERNACFLAAAAAALGKIREDRALPILVTALRNIDDCVQANAARAIGAIGGKDVMPQLLRDLRSPNGNTAAGAARALGELKARAAAHDLVRLLRAENTEVVQSAADALEGLNDASVIPDLIQDLHTGPITTRQAAVEVLGQMKGPEVVDALCVALLTDSDDDIRGAAARALGEIKDTTATKALTLAAKDHVFRVRRDAAEALEILAGSP